MAKKKQRSGGGNNKPHGHYCYVCGEHKANERFSGKGHANHMCKACSALPVAERSEMIAIRKIENMAFRYLSEAEINWLRKRMKDSRSDVRKAATEVHQIKFPRYERNMEKKGLTAFSLELFLHHAIYDEYGDEVAVHARIRAERSGLFRLIDYNLPEGEWERETQTEPKEAKRILKTAVQQLEAPFWDEDYSDKKYEYDPYLDVLHEYRPDYDDCNFFEDDENYEDKPDVMPPENREPVCSLQIELNNGEDKKIVFYNSMPDKAEELFWALMEYFVPDENEFDEYEE